MRDLFGKLSKEQQEAWILDVLYPYCFGTKSEIINELRSWGFVMPGYCMLAFDKAIRRLKRKGMIACSDRHWGISQSFKKEIDLHLIKYGCVPWAANLTQ